MVFHSEYDKKMNPVPLYFVKKCRGWYECDACKMGINKGQPYYYSMGGYRTEWCEPCGEKRKGFSFFRFVGVGYHQIAHPARKSCKKEKRNLGVLKLLQQGKQYRDIGRIFGITYQRVQQIGTSMGFTPKIRFYYESRECVMCKNEFFTTLSSKKTWCSAVCSRGFHRPGIVWKLFGRPYKYLSPEEKKIHANAVYENWKATGRYAAYHAKPETKERSRENVLRQKRRGYFKEYYLRPDVRERMNRKARERRKKLSTANKK